MHYLNLIPPAETVLERIKKRAAEDPHRRGELRDFGTLEQVESAIEHAKGRASKEKSGVDWEEFDCLDKLSERIAELLR